MDFSGEFGLTPHIVEKDYVLGWLLAGIAHHSELSASWIFKGGTCLKKCYFETYRFSEDLDFTVSKAEHLAQDFLIDAYQQVAAWIYEKSGIEMPGDFFSFEIYENPRGKTSVLGRLSYRGPLKQRAPLPRIRLDITADEVLVLAPIPREVHHPYSDRPMDGIMVQCYCYEELFAEKIRALSERLRPRDLYDVIHIYRHEGSEPDRMLVLDVLKKKCEFKGMPIPTIEILQNKPELDELKSEWKNMLAHQLPILPSFGQFWQELPVVFEWLHAEVEKLVSAPAPPLNYKLQETWRPPAMIQAWNAPVPLEIIRFAAANRLCVDLAYNNEHRLIEPYSLRMTKDEEILLYAIKHQTGELRAYRVDRIQSARATDVLFTPRYKIELTAAGTLSAPLVAARRVMTPAPKGFRQHKPRGTSSIQPGYGPKYIFECPLCRRKFTRKAYDSSLNPHKDKNGYDCAGRVGIFINTKY